MISWKQALLAAVAIVFAALRIASSNHHVTFEQWKAEHGRTYSSTFEEAYREMVWTTKLAAAEAHNSNSSHTYKMGLNQFSDLTREEYIHQYLTLKPITSTVELSDEESAHPNGDIDWVVAGKVTLIKDQGSCGSCWAFSAVAALESGVLIAGQPQQLFSEQQLVDCARSFGNQGCQGGWMDNAFKYVIAKGIASQFEYPYVAVDQTCKIDGGQFKIKSFVDLSGCNNIANALTSRPISVAVDASNWDPYQSGIFSNCGQSVNHGVLVVGIKNGFWLIKNSFGRFWGESGYIRLGPGNTCGLCSYPSYPIL